VFSGPATQAAQRFFVLTQTDNLWKEHLQAIKFLQQAVSLRGYAQVPCLGPPSVWHFREEWIFRLLDVDASLMLAVLQSG
jgi:SecA Wing and Scaffold domain